MASPCLLVIREVHEMSTAHQESSHSSTDEVFEVHNGELYSGITTTCGGGRRSAWWNVIRLFKK